MPPSPRVRLVIDEAISKFQEGEDKSLVALLSIYDEVIPNHAIVDKSVDARHGDDDVDNNNLGQMLGWQYKAYETWLPFPKTEPPRVRPNPAHARLR